MTWSLRLRAVCRRPPGVADQLGEAALDGGVDVLVGRAEGEVAAAKLVLDALQARVDGAASSPEMIPCAAEHPGVGARGGQVLGPEAAVDLERGVEAVERLGRAGRRSARPRGARRRSCPRAAAARAAARARR